MQLIKVCLPILTVVSAGAFASVATGPAPAGDPNTVAMRVIRQAEHPCQKVVEAARDPRAGSIFARCSNGLTFLIFTVDMPGKGVRPVALNCDAAAKIGVSCGRK